MTRNTAVTVRLPGASSAPTTNTWTCSQTRLENTGANFTISRVRATGTVSMPHLFWHKSGDQLTNLLLCFQSTLQMDKVELRSRSRQLVGSSAGNVRSRSGLRSEPNASDQRVAPP